MPVLRSARPAPHKAELYPTAKSNSTPVYHPSFHPPAENLNDTQINTSRHARASSHSTPTVDASQPSRPRRSKVSSREEKKSIYDHPRLVGFTREPIGDDDDLPPWPSSMSVDPDSHACGSDFDMYGPSLPVLGDLDDQYETDYVKQEEPEGNLFSSTSLPGPSSTGNNLPSSSTSVFSFLPLSRNIQAHLSTMALSSLSQPVPEPAKRSLWSSIHAQPADEEHEHVKDEISSTLAVDDTDMSLRGSVPLATPTPADFTAYESIEDRELTPMPAPLWLNRDYVQSDDGDAEQEDGGEEMITSDTIVPGRSGRVSGWADLEHRFVQDSDVSMHVPSDRPSHPAPDHERRTYPLTPSHPFYGLPPQQSNSNYTLPPSDILHSPRPRNAGHDFARASILRQDRPNEVKTNVHPMLARYAGRRAVAGLQSLTIPSTSAPERADTRRRDRMDIELSSPLEAGLGKRKRSQKDVASHATVSSAQPRTRSTGGKPSTSTTASPGPRRSEDTLRRGFQAILDAASELDGSERMSTFTSGVSSTVHVYQEPVPSASAANTATRTPKVKAKKAVKSFSRMHSVKATDILGPKPLKPKRSRISITPKPTYGLHQLPTPDPSPILGAPTSSSSAIKGIERTRTPPPLCASSDSPTPNAFLNHSPSSDHSPAGILPSDATLPPPTSPGIGGGGRYTRLTTSNLSHLPSLLERKSKPRRPSVRIPVVQTPITPESSPVRVKLSLRKEKMRMKEHAASPYKAGQERRSKRLKGMEPSQSEEV